MPSKTITVTNGDGSTRTITIPDRSRFAGVRNISRAVNELPLTDDTTSIQVTVEGHADISGIYTPHPTINQSWNQQGGAGTISASNFNETNGYEYLLQDESDTDPQYLLNNNAGFTDRPWKANGQGFVTITGIAGTETLTVNRTAPVITSDRKGESRPLLSKLVGGAAAAYSLRDLNDKAGNNKVVRVRRASDNNERDFLAKEVSNGTLQNWVNTQTVLPLDIQALTADGRTGSVIPAKAAYSLRNLSKNYTGNVVDVRRSSDDTTQGFTAAQVTDGTLLSFVNEIQTLGTVTNSVGNDGFTLTNTSSTGFTATTDTATGVCGWAYTAKAGDKITVSFDAVVRSGTPQFIPRKATALSGSNLVDVVSDSAISINSTASYSFEFTYDSDEAGSLTFSEGDDNADFDISNFQVTSFKGNGLLSKWYDQSGEDNHAVQADPADQPKIVNAGSVMLNDDGHPAIGFQRLSGGSTYFDLTTGIDIANSHSFQYVEFQKTYTYTLVESAGGGSNRLGYLTGSQLRLFRGGSLNFSAGTTITNNPFIYTTFLAADGSASKVNVNGDEVLNQVLGNGTGGTTFNAIFRGDNSGLDSQFTKLSELIIYDTEQTDNRTAIEANIGEAYSITGIPAYDNTVDGFVETWYDQSGENFNMTQAESTKQPKIVENGTFLGSVKYDGATSYLKSASYFNITNQAVSLFTVQTPVGGNDSTLGATNSGRGISFENSVVRVFITQSAHVDNHVAGGSGFLIGSAIHTGDGSSDQIKTSRNGVPVVDPSPSSTDIASDGQPIFTTQYNVIGGNRVETSNSNFFNGEIKEVVIWKTNQLANRPAIEANINNQYDIY